MNEKKVGKKSKRQTRRSERIESYLAYIKPILPDRVMDRCKFGANHLSQAPPIRPSAIDESCDCHPPEMAVLFLWMCFDGFRNTTWIKKKDGLLNAHLSTLKFVKIKKLYEVMKALEKSFQLRPIPLL